LCTVSWIRGAEGYQLFFNRDEKRSRGHEIPPALLRQGGVALLAPRDGDFGGSWLAVNELGFTAGLLNGYVPRRGELPKTTRSRGLLLLDVAAARRRADAARLLEHTSLVPYEPFHMLLLDSAGASVFTWDGAAGDVEHDADARSPLFSSGFEQERARAGRRAIFEDLRRARGGLGPALLAEYHASHGPEGPGPFTPCMHRDDAETRSLCEVRVDAREVRLVYTPGPPCRTRSAGSWSLSRRGNELSAVSS